ncbi:MAG: cation-translocating P-type ATPase [Deltaproteobacteria bacterium]|nr:cation-translocating P-type ATPase [Deltaproteobacteria bacterium]
MLPARPHLPSQPCPACGRDVDPLRAGRVLWLEDGARFLCGGECRARFLRGEHEFDAPSARPGAGPPLERPSIPDLVREATVVRDSDDGGDRPEARARRYDPVAASGLALLALGLLFLTPSRGLVWIAAFLVVLCAVLNARIPLTAVRATSSLRVVAPIGLALAAVSGVLAPDPESQRWALVGAAIAAIAVSVRSWVHSSLSASLRSGARELRETLPLRARVPSHDSSAYEEVPSARLRQGDLVVVLEGELAPADGVIEEGSGLALQYPRAAHARPYDEGDFILAGTRMLEGAATIRVRRTGRDRGIVRALELGRRKQQERAAASRLRGPTGAATFLLGIPVLALLASLDVPLDAGALASARRGMFFGSSRALRDAGRTGTAAILLRGALTAGEPIVQQAHSLGSMELGRVLALAASVEKAAEDHPIARAIRRYAEEHGDASAAVRKERVRAGLGVTAVTSHGVPVVVGRRQLLLDEGISVATADSDATHLESEGLTPIFIAIDGHLEALVAILDPVQVGARDAVQRIADLPSDVFVLSGDDRRTVERIAAQLGAPQVKAPLLPHERVTEVRALRETGGITATIARGGEDDAVLAASDVPISLRLLGSGLEDRGVVIASHDVRDAAGALWVARAVRRATWRGIGSCGLAATLVVLGATMGWMTPVLGALCGLATEAWALRAGSRLLRRVDLRVPMQQ